VSRISVARSSTRSPGTSTDSRSTGGSQPVPTSSGTFTLVVASLGFFMVSLDATIVNVALPTLGHDLGAGLTDLQWIVAGYTLTFAAALLSGGALADRFGARRMFAVGLGMFTSASAGCGLAPSSSVLIAARLAQGVGAALLVPCSLALIRNAYPELRARGRAIGIWAAAGGTAVAAGPVFGGVLIHLVGWRSIFLVNLPVGAIALALALARVLPSPRTPRRIDIVGQLLAAAAICGLSFALIDGAHLGWTAPSVLTSLAITILSAMGLLKCERTVTDPMLPPSLVRRPAFAGAAIIGGLLNLAFYGQVFVLSLFFQQVLHQSALQAGLSFLPMTGLIAAANLAAPRLAARFGSLPVIVVGQALFAIGLLAVLTVGSHSSSWHIGFTLLGIGTGAGLSIPPLTSRLLDSVPGSLAGVASGAFNSSRQIGGAIGVAVSGAFLTASGTEFSHGMRLSLVVAATAVVVGIGLSLALLRRPSPELPSTS
jgi:MFS transporter, DHA2 family, methylenomycin A resistance protein